MDRSELMGTEFKKNEDFGEKDHKLVIVVLTEIRISGFAGSLQ